jgi:hypothetical protein
MPVPEVLTADTAGEVDEAASVGVGDPRALRLGDDEPRRRDRRGDVLPALGRDPLRLCPSGDGHSGRLCP